MGEAWMIASAHGGEGKTTVAAHLGRALAGRGRRVALMDLNIGYGDLDMVLGLQDSVVYHLLDALRGLCRLSQSLVRDPSIEGLYLLAAPANEDGGVFREVDFARVLASLKEHFDYVLMDAPPGGSELFRIAAGHADRVLLVCAQGRAPRGAKHMLGRLFQAGAGPVGVVLNKADKRRGFAVDGIDAEFLGAIPRDAGLLRRDGMIGGSALEEMDRLAGVLLMEDAPQSVNGRPRGDLIRRFQNWLDGAQ